MLIAASRGCLSCCAPKLAGMTNFDEEAPQWDTPIRLERTRALAAQMLSQMSPLPGGPDGVTVVDLGCGTGVLGSSFARGLVDARGGDCSVTLVGVDPSAQMRERASERGLVVVDSLEAAQQFAPVDVIVSSMAFHHIDDVAGALASCAALLRPGGWLFVADLDEGQEFFHAHLDTPIDGFNRDGFVEALESVGLSDVTIDDGYVGSKPDHADPTITHTYTVFLASGRALAGQ